MWLHCSARTCGMCPCHVRAPFQRIDPCAATGCSCGEGVDAADDAAARAGTPAEGWGWRPAVLCGTPPSAPGAIREREADRHGRIWENDEEKLTRGSTWDKPRGKRGGWEGTRGMKRISVRRGQMRGMGERREREVRDTREARARESRGRHNG